MSNQEKENAALKLLLQSLDQAESLARQISCRTASEYVGGLLDQISATIRMLAEDVERLI